MELLQQFIHRLDLAYVECGFVFTKPSHLFCGYKLQFDLTMAIHINVVTAACSRLPNTASLNIPRVNNARTHGTQDFTSMNVPKGPVIESRSFQVLKAAGGVVIVILFPPDVAMQKTNRKFGFSLPMKLKC